MVGGREWNCWWDVVEFAPRGTLLGCGRAWRRAGSGVFRRGGKAWQQRARRNEQCRESGIGSVCLSVLAAAAASQRSCGEER